MGRRLLKVARTIEVEMERLYLIAYSRGYDDASNNIEPRGQSVWEAILNESEKVANAREGSQENL